MHNDDAATDAERAGLAASGTSAGAESPAITDLVRYPLLPMEAELARRFKYHPPKPDQLPRYEYLRRAGRGLAEEIVMLTPPGREQSLALTKLEEALMHANSAIARGE